MRTTTLAVLVFLFAGASFTAATYSLFIGGDALVWQLGTLSVPALFVAVIFSNFRRQHGLLQFAGKMTSVAMGVLNFAFLSALLCWPAIWVSSGLGFSISQGRIAWTLLGCSVVVAGYGLVNAARLRVTRYTVHLRNLPATWRGRHVALVSDIHIGAIWGPNFVRDIINRLKELQPAAVFIPGDMFDGAKVDLPRAVEPWREFRAPAGIYFVTGNHDEFVDRAPYIAALKTVGITVLQNEKVTVDGLQIVGIHDFETHRATLFRQLLEQARIDRNQPSILLSHRPTHLDIPAEAGISLQLSGHTHAGQFPLWTLLVRKIYGRFAYGLNRWGSLQVVTSSGAGSGGPPLRVGTRSEIVLLRLEAAVGELDPNPRAAPGLRGRQAEEHSIRRA